jgi:D-arabinose 1-dehydrogenase-like Zn-dependent alcohol dehydrogenase
MRFRLRRIGADAAAGVRPGDERRRVVVVGEHGDSVPVTSTAIAQRELEIVGTRNGTRQDLVEAIRLVELGHIRPPIAACYPLEAVNDAMKRLRAGVIGRLVIRVASD